MIYSCLAAALAVATYGQLDPNVKTGTGDRCNNYIAMGNKLYPVGDCYHENLDDEEICESPTGNCGGDESDQNMMFKCEATANGTEACQYRMGLGCNGEIQKIGECYPCNGAEDQCECVVGGTASECQVYEKTQYVLSLGFNGWYCDQKIPELDRYIVNMCIQGSSGGQGYLSTTGYACGGYDSRSGKNQDYAYTYNTFGNAQCETGPVPTSPPTPMTNAPSEAPTETGETGSGSLWCSESTCDGVDSPRADSANSQSIIIAVTFAIFSSIMSL